MITKRFALFAVLAVATAGLALAQDSVDPATDDASSEWTTGLVFATDSILLDISSFNGGVGIVRRSDDTAIRATVGLLGTNRFDTLSTQLGFWYMKYLNTGRVSPYWNVFAKTETLSRTEEIDAENWTRDSSLSFGGGLSLGVEFFLLDFLSLFAEYSLSAGLSGTRAVTSVAGEVTQEDYTWVYSVSTDIANAGAIGIVVYFTPQVELGE